MSSFSQTNGTDYNSTNIDKIVYDEAAETMEVAFIGAKSYLYKGVDSNTAQQMATAESKTRFLNENIKNRFEFETL